MAAWRAGTPLNPNFGIYNPMDIPKIPGYTQTKSFDEAKDLLAEMGGKIIAIQNPNPDWTKAPGAGNFATYFGTYWEYADHGGPDRMIIHSTDLDLTEYPYTIYVVVPPPEPKP